MHSKIKILQKQRLNSVEYEKVYDDAIKLKSFLDQDDIRRLIKETHKVGAKSSDIEKILESKLQELGFESQKKRLFSEYTTSGIRPDFYKPLGVNTGILIEVERGKTITNNMDILDVWKCHICKYSNYLFLVVPIVRQTKKKRETTTFETVVNRLKSFYDSEQNYINVDAIFVFGY